MPRADEMSAPAFQRTAEMKAHIGCGPIGVAGPIDVNFAPEEWNKNAPLSGNIGQVAEFVFHRPFLLYTHLQQNTCNCMYCQD